MSEQQNKNTVQQFRTVVAGFRLHGQLVLSSSDSNSFVLNIQSSANKQEKYEITFNSQSLKIYKLDLFFSQPEQLYDHLSKMTKTKVKFSNEGKIFCILGEKQKAIHQFPINLSEYNQSQPKQQKNEVQTTYSQPHNEIIEKLVGKDTTQRENERTQDQNNLLIQHCESQHGPIDLEAKIQQLRRIRQQARLKQEGQKPIRQMKDIGYKFAKRQNQQQTLYEEAFSLKIDHLADLIENQQLDSAEQIVLKRCRLQEIPSLNQISLKNVRILSLEENKIKTILKLQSLVNLQKLNLDGNKLTKIDNISHLINLKSLKLGNNQISTISGLEKINNLQTLWLDFNNIQQIQNLSGLSKLKSLNLSFNMIQKMQNLGCLSNLEELLLNENKISQIQNIQNLCKLIRLSINMNVIKRIKGVKKLLLLQVLYLNQNQIEYFDKDAFEEINWLKMLKQFKICANYIEWNEQSKSYIERLRKYGIKVFL